MSRRTSRTPFRRGVFGLFGGLALVPSGRSVAFPRSSSALEYIPNFAEFAKLGSNALAKNNSTTHRHRITVAVHVNGNLLNNNSHIVQPGARTFLGCTRDMGTSTITYTVSACEQLN